MLAGRTAMLPTCMPPCKRLVHIWLAASSSCYTGGDSVDNGVDQLIIDGEAMPVLKDLIRGGRTPGVQEGAVRLLTRLCSTPDAREHVSHAYNHLCLSAYCMA